MISLYFLKDYEKYINLIFLMKFFEIIFVMVGKKNQTKLIKKIKGRKWKKLKNEKSSKIEHGCVTHHLIRN